MQTVPEPIAVDARAKIMWGESPAKVRAFLLAKEISEADADALLEEIAVERAESIREDGVKKALLGAGMVIAPIAYYYAAHLLFEFWSLKLFAALLVVAAVGVVKLARGLAMVFRPRSIAGDLSNASG